MWLRFGVSNPTNGRESWTCCLTAEEFPRRGQVDATACEFNVSAVESPIGATEESTKSVTEANRRDPGMLSGLDL